MAQVRRNAGRDAEILRLSKEGMTIRSLGEKYRLGEGGIKHAIGSAIRDRRIADTNGNDIVAILGIIKNDGKVIRTISDLREFITQNRNWRRKLREENKNMTPKLLSSIHVLAVEHEITQPLDVAQRKLLLSLGLTRVMIRFFEDELGKVPTLRDLAEFMGNPRWRDDAWNCGSENVKDLETWGRTRGFENSTSLSNGWNTELFYRSHKDKNIMVYKITKMFTATSDKIAESFEKAVSGLAEDSYIEKEVSTKRSNLERLDKIEIKVIVTTRSDLGLHELYYKFTQKIDGLISA